MPWASVKNLTPKQQSVAAGTGLSTAFGSNVAAGNVIVAASLFLTTGASTPTFSDTSGNVTTWHSSGQQVAAGPGFSLAIAWGIATSTGACTPKIAWSSGGTQIMELFGGEFSTPGGTVSQDGTAVLVGSPSSSTSMTVTANGTLTGDLLAAIFGCGNTFGAWTGSWVAMGASVGDDAGYLLNAAGNSAATATQSPAGTYGGLVIALNAAGGATTLSPTGLAHTRSQGAPAVNPKLAPAGQAHTRAQGALKTNPKLAPAGLAHTRTLGNPTIPGITVRALGTLTVTSLGHPRPAGQAHSRALGLPTIIGRDLQPAGQAHSRAQGNPTLSARAQPAGIAHGRAQGAPAVNRATLTPAGLARSGAAGTRLILTPVATDNFNRANGTLATGNWAATSDGSMAISSNEAIGTTSAIKGDQRTGETYSSDHYSQITVGTVNNISSSFVGPAVRCQSDTSTCYVAIYFDDGPPPHINLYKRTAPGAFTLLADHKLPLGGLTAGDTLTLIAEGSQITVQVNGVGAFTLIDTTIPTGGTPGITSFHAITLDNWQGGNAATVALPAAAATDNFTRANNGMSVSQANWQTMTGYPAVDIPIVSNELNASTGSHAADVRTDSYTADQFSQILRGSTDVDATGFIGLLVRVQGDLIRGYLGCYFGHAEVGVSNPANAPSSYRIYRLDNISGSGASILLAACGSKADNTTTFNPAGTQYALVAEGTRLSFRVNGKEVLATTDAAYASGQPGIMNFPGSTADNWGAGNVLASGRALGNLAVTTSAILRPAGQAHARQQGNPSLRGLTTIPAGALTHPRAQGNPTLSARALPASIVHARQPGSPAVNTRTLAPVAITRA